MTCNQALRKEGKPYPRTCAECGLGPCKYPLEKEKVQEWPPAFSIVEKTPAEWAVWLESLPDHDERQAFIQNAIESAYKQGFRDGNDSEDGVGPWEKEDKP